MQNTFNTNYIKVSTTAIAPSDFELKTKVWENEQVYKNTAMSCVRISGPLPVMLKEFQALTSEGYTLNESLPASSLGAVSCFLSKPKDQQKEDLLLIKVEVERQYSEAIASNFEAHKATLIEQALQAEHQKAVDAENAKQAKLEEKVRKQVEDQLQEVQQ